MDPELDVTVDEVIDLLQGDLPTDDQKRIRFEDYTGWERTEDNVIRLIFLDGGPCFEITVRKE